MSKKKVMTIRDFGGDDDHGHDDDDHDHDDDKPQTYYAGGARNSGQLIVDPTKKKQGGDVAQELFARASEHGAVSASEARQRFGEQHFMGAGYTVGDNHRPSERHQGEQGVLRRTLALWENGFTIDDSALYSFDNPAHAQLLQSIMQGQAPPELLDPNDPHREIELNLVRKGKPYSVPTKKSSVFAGEGRSLASSSSDAASSSQAVPAIPTSTQPLTVDPALPTTTIAVRLASGERIVQQFNVSHTVGDVYAWVASRSHGHSFELLCTMPRKTLVDMGETVEQAGIKGAALTQKQL